MKVNHLILDVLMFPFGLLTAILEWFNFFTLRHTGKPLVGGRNG